MRTLNILLCAFVSLIGHSWAQADDILPDQLQDPSRKIVSLDDLARRGSSTHFSMQLQECDDPIDLLIPLLGPSLEQDNDRAAGLILSELYERLPDPRCLSALKNSASAESRQRYLAEGWYMRAVQKLRYDDVFRDADSSVKRTRALIDALVAACAQDAGIEPSAWYLQLLFADARSTFETEYDNQISGNRETVFGPEAREVELVDAVVCVCRNNAWIKRTGYGVLAYAWQVEGARTYLERESQSISISADIDAHVMDVPVEVWAGTARRFNAARMEGIEIIQSVERAHDSVDQIRKHVKNRISKLDLPSDDPVAGVLLLYLLRRSAPAEAYLDLIFEYGDRGLYQEFAKSEPGAATEFVRGFEAKSFAETNHHNFLEALRNEHPREFEKVVAERIEKDTDQAAGLYRLLSLLPESPRSKEILSVALGSANHGVSATAASMLVRRYPDRDTIRVLQGVLEQENTSTELKKIIEVKIQRLEKIIEEQENQ